MHSLFRPSSLKRIDTGNIETGDDSTVITAAPSHEVGALSGATATVTGGVATFTGLAVDTAGTVAFDFSGGGFTAGPSDDLVVSPAAASQWVVSNPADGDGRGRPGHRHSARHR